MYSKFMYPKFMQFAYPDAARRYAISFGSALAVVFGLFWLMQFLIATANRELGTEEVGKLVEFIQPDRIQTVDTRRPPKPPTTKPPPETPPPEMDQVAPETDPLSVSIDMDMRFTGSRVGFAGGDYLPLFKVEPRYPPRALSRGIEGYVIVEFTVTVQGTTKDHVVVEANPSGIFDRAAIQAAQKFKYKPRVVDGQPIEVPGVQNKITFQIEE